METLALPRTPSLPLYSCSPLERHDRFRGNPRFRVACSPLRSQAMDTPKSEYKPGIFDDLLLKFFRKKMVEEVGWDSVKPGYAGLIEVANCLMMKGKSNSETEQAAVRVLQSLFPPFLLVLFKMLVAPIGGGRVASMMAARATTLSCQWLMGPCLVNAIDLPDGSSCTSGVFVDRCKYLEESKCVGICINTCKLPTQTFFKECMGVPLHMEPDFSDYSCQFNFGIQPPPRASDKALQEPCLDTCLNANRRRELGGRNADIDTCPKNYIRGSPSNDNALDLNSNTS